MSEIDLAFCYSIRNKYDSIKYNQSISQTQDFGFISLCIYVGGAYKVHSLINLWRTQS